MKAKILGIALVIGWLALPFVACAGAFVIWRHKVTRYRVLTWIAGLFCIDFFATDTWSRPVRFLETGETSQGYSRGGTVLNANGRFFFHDRQQVDARDLKRKLKVFPNIVKGATADLALTEAEICDIESAEVLERWGYKAGTVGVSLAGDQVIVHDTGKDELVVYEVRP